MKKQRMRINLSAIPKGKLLIFLVCILSFFLNVYGLSGLLPSKERVGLYFSDFTLAEKIYANVQEEAVRKSMTEEPSVATVYLNPLRSFHPDESNFIKLFTNMNFRKMKFNPHYFWYGTFFIWIEGLFFGVAYLLGLLSVKFNLFYYLLHPECLARIYMVGRLPSLISGTVSVYLTYRIALKMFSSSRIAVYSALLLATANMFVIYAHFISPDMIALMIFLFFTSIVVSHILMAENPSVSSYVKSGILIGLVANTKYSFIWACLLLILADGLNRRIPLKRWIIAGVCSIGIFLITNPFMLTEPQEAFGWMVRVAGFARPGGILLGTTFYLKSLYLGIGTVTFILIMITLIYTFYMLITGKYETRTGKGIIFLLSWIFIFFIFFTTAEKKMAHYILPIYPALMIICALCLVNKRKHWGNILMILGIVANSLITVSYLNIFAGENSRVAAAKWIKSNIPCGSVVGYPQIGYQFIFVPVDFITHKIKDMNFNPEILQDEAVDYIIFNGAIRGDTPPEFPVLPAKRFLESLMSGDNGYKLVKKFPEKTPYLLRYHRDTVGWGPYQILVPRIWIFAKTGVI